MIAHILIGAAAMAAIFFLVDYDRKNNCHLTWWEWLLAALNVLYFVFVAEVIYGFLAEGAPRAALVTGFLTGIIGIIWAVLLSRFSFGSSGKSTTAERSSPRLD